MSMAGHDGTSTQLAVCIRNDGYPVSLERLKLYQVLPDPEAAKHNQFRVVDESGEDYLYPADYFIVVRLPEAVEGAVMATLGSVQVRENGAPITVQEAVKQLLRIVEGLQRAYTSKKFTLDGRLVGDLGEVLVEGTYDVKLFEGVKRHHDAETPDGRLVQIKATMQSALTFPADFVPKYYLGIQIHSDGNFTEVFNGPGSIASEAVRNRKRPNTNLHTITVSRLKQLNKKVQDRERIPMRASESSN